MMLEQLCWGTFRVVPRERGLVAGPSHLPRASSAKSNVGLGGGEHVLWDG